MKKMRKSFSLVIVLVFAIQLAAAVMPMHTVEAAVAVYPPNDPRNMSRELKVVGNKVVYKDDPTVEVTLRGVHVPSLEWSPIIGGESVLDLVKYAMNTLDSNLIRLSVGFEGWFFEWPQKKLSEYQIPTSYDPGGERYREFIDEVVNEVSRAGKYLVLDLHHYHIFNNQWYVDFWDSAAERYKNNPTVLFGLLNEPTVGWDEWLNGNPAPGNVHGQVSVGHQFMVERVRETGAKNILIAGGRSYTGSLDVIGVDKGYDLIDQGSGGDRAKRGNGIMYDLHKYPGHGVSANWHAAAGAARLRYPILMGEFGWVPYDAEPDVLGEKYARNPSHAQHHSNWFPEIFEWMNDYETYGNRVHWTAFSFHPGAAPTMIQNVNRSKNAGSKGTYIKDGVYQPRHSRYPGQYYTQDFLNTYGEEEAKSSWATAPIALTDYFGKHVANELARVLDEDNLARGITPSSVNTSSTSDPAKATDGNEISMWLGDKGDPMSLELDLGGIYNINRWYVRHSPVVSQITSDFKLQYKLQVGDEWADADSISGVVSGNLSPVTDRFIKTTTARYVRLLITKPSPAGAAARIAEFAVMKDSTPVYNKTEAYYNLHNPYGLVVKREFNAARGDEIANEYWSSADKIRTYLNEGENGSRIVRINGTTSNFVYSGSSGVFNDLRGVEYYSFRIKSNSPLTLQIIGEYRVAPQKEVKSELVEIPSTGGVWKDVIVTAEDFGYSASNPWVKQVYHSYSTNFNPAMRLHISGNNVDIATMKSHWHGEANIAGLDFYNNNVDSNDGLKAGTTNILLTLRNPSNNAMDGGTVVAAVYCKTTHALVSLDRIDVSVATGILEHNLTLNMPDGADPNDHYIKVFALKDMKDIKPYSNPFEFHWDGARVTKR